MNQSAVSRALRYKIIFSEPIVLSEDVRSPTRQLKVTRRAGAEGQQVDQRRVARIYHVVPHPAPVEEEALVGRTCCLVPPQGEEADVCHVMAHPAPPCKGVSRQARGGYNEVPGRSGARQRIAPLVDRYVASELTTNIFFFVFLLNINTNTCGECTACLHV